MEDYLAELIESAGITAEYLKIFYDAFKNAGFDEPITQYFCTVILQRLLDDAEDLSENVETEENGDA